jgi:hypothetical protein
MKTGTDRRRCMRASAIAVSVLSITLSACSTTKPPDPAQMSRTAVETAPADLQLLCADAGAKASGVAGSKALPVTSRRIDAKTYHVDLNVNGSAQSCIIDDAGNVLSVRPSIA